MPDAATDDDPDVVVLRQKVHGMPAAEYAAAVRERLPDHDVVLADTPAGELDLLGRGDVATGIHLDGDRLDAAGIDLFACVYAGTDHLPLDALRERGIAVTNASGVHGPNIAEYVVGAIVAFVREFWTARENQRERRWESFHVDELMGSTVTVVGMGAIGEAVVDRLDAFGVETLGVRHTPSKGGPTDEVFGYDDLHAALARTDHLVLACPLTERTEGLVDADAFMTLPSHATVTNIARGPVIDTEALVTALRDNHVGGAALDVTDPEPLPEDHPLWGFDDVFITPHNAGNTPHYYERRADILARNLRQVAESGTYEDLENQII